MRLDDAGIARAAKTWVSSAPVDVEFYATLRGRGFSSVAEAAEDWVRVGMPARLAPDPFLDFHSLPAEIRRSWRSQDVTAVLRHLAGGRWGPLAGCHGDPGVREAMLDTASMLASGASHVPRADRDPYDESGTTVVVVAPSLNPAARAVHRLVEESGEDVQVVVVDAGTPAHAALGLHARLLRDGIRGLRVAPDAPRRAALELALSWVRGARLVLMSPHVLVRPGWLPPLLAELSDPGTRGAVPLVLDELDLIASDGALQGHPAEDAQALAHETVPAGPYDLLVLRSQDHPSRAGQAAADVRFVPASRVTALGTSRTPLPDVPLPAIEPEVRRWSLRLPSTPGFHGDTWGDTFFADALARSLRRLGQQVVSRRRGAHERGPVELDHVNLAIRGLHPVQASPGAVNVLWVISHPDDVELDELAGYDIVCAASEHWSALLEERSGRPVRPLLQATEFGPPEETLSEPTDPAIVFVGNLDRRRARPMVERVLEAGVPLAVYGKGWQGLPPGIWRGQHVDNAFLPQLYRRHRIVLADHWSDMAKHGFVANRVFDAVASGARVISDHVAGLHDVFPPHLVAAADSPAEVRAAYERFVDQGSPDVPDLSVSFDDRAHTLIDLVRAEESRIRGFGSAP